MFLTQWRRKIKKPCWVIKINFVNIQIRIKTRWVVSTALISGLNNLRRIRALLLTPHGMSMGSRTWIPLLLERLDHMYVCAHVFRAHKHRFYFIIVVSGLPELSWKSWKRRRKVCVMATEDQTTTWHPAGESSPRMLWCQVCNKKRKQQGKKQTNKQTNKKEKLKESQSTLSLSFQFRDYTCRVQLQVSVSCYLEKKRKKRRMKSVSNELLVN